jgi:hypothetical protein
MIDMIEDFQKGMLSYVYIKGIAVNLFKSLVGSCWLASTCSMSGGRMRMHHMVHQMGHLQISKHHISNHTYRLQHDKILQRKKNKKHPIDSMVDPTS